MAQVTCRTAWPPEVEFPEPQRRAIVAVTVPAYLDQAARPAPEQRERADLVVDRPGLGQVVCELTQAARRRICALSQDHFTRSQISDETLRPCQPTSSIQGKIEYSRRRQCHALWVRAPPPQPRGDGMASICPPRN
jgi:hypothetical protein